MVSQSCCCPTSLTQFCRSSPLNIENIGMIHFRLISAGTNEVQLMNADVRLGGPTIFVFISQTDSWPFVIENMSDYPIAVHQAVSSYSAHQRTHADHDDRTPIILTDPQVVGRYQRTRFPRNRT